MTLREDLLDGWFPGPGVQRLVCPSLCPSQLRASLQEVLPNFVSASRQKNELVLEVEWTRLRDSLTVVSTRPACPGGLSPPSSPLLILLPSRLSSCHPEHPHDALSQVGVSGHGLPCRSPEEPAPSGLELQLFLKEPASGLYWVGPGREPGEGALGRATGRQCVELLLTCQRHDKSNCPDPSLWNPCFQFKTPNERGDCVGALAHAHADGLCQAVAGTDSAQFLVPWSPAVGVSLGGKAGVKPAPASLPASSHTASHKHWLDRRWAPQLGFQTPPHCPLPVWPLVGPACLSRLISLRFPLPVSR